MGNVATTVSGKTCQAWTSDFPHSHSYHSDSMYPDGSVSAAGNKCRNPDSGWNYGAWCYTTDPSMEWDYCDIPPCPQEGECIPRPIRSFEFVQLKQLQQKYSESTDLRQGESAADPESIFRLRMWMTYNKFNRGFSVESTSVIKCL